MSHTFSRVSAACAGVAHVSNAAVWSELGANGGPTDRVPLLAGTAVDAAPAPDCCEEAFGVPVLTNQRGVTRGNGPAGAHDIGAFEVVR